MFSCLGYETTEVKYHYIGMVISDRKHDILRLSDTKITLRNRNCSANRNAFEELH